MTISCTISAVLHGKGSQVFSVSPQTTVQEAIRIMAEKNVGALVVLESDRLVGVFSERDYTRKIALPGKSPQQTPVTEALSAPVISVPADATVEECMRLMTSHRVRHLPVLESQKLLGIVSIGDLVNWIISAQGQEIDQLRTFITGQYPG
jgi:CBS domain-containing protein